MPKLFDDENVGVFMNIDEKHCFALTAGKRQHERRGERLVCLQVKIARILS